MSRTARRAASTSSREARLVPSVLPIRSFASDATKISAPVKVKIVGNAVAIEGRVPSGLPVSVTIPVRMFRGVAVRLVPVGSDRVGVTLELLHTDPSLTVPLAVAGRPEDIIADWQEWASALGLPLLVVDEDGSVFDPSSDGDHSLNRPATPNPRRHASHFADRRPRFLTRRKVGRPVSFVQDV